MPPKKRPRLTTKRKNAAHRYYLRISRLRESQQQTSERQLLDRSRHSARRAQETPQETSERQLRDRSRQLARRAQETSQETSERQLRDRSRHSARRAQETSQETSERQLRDRSRHSARRAQETPQETSERQLRDKSRHSARRAQETPQETSERQLRDKSRHSARRAQETPQETSERQLRDRSRHSAFRSQQNSEKWNNLAFRYDANTSYSSDPEVHIGSMSKMCEYCQAYKWNDETPSICCSSGKVQVPPLSEPPPVLTQLLLGNTSESKHFLRHIQEYNAAFQMTSFGANVITEGAFMPTFKVQGQVYHLVGALQPPANEEPKYLQLYFITNYHEQATARHSKHPNTRIEVIIELQDMLHSNNSYIRSLKCALEFPFLGRYEIVIDADKRPSEQHPRRYNPPECNEVGLIMSGDCHGTRDIVLQQRDNTIKRICETHRSYDALQYPLLFPNGDDGYHFGIPLQTSTSSTKMVSCTQFYTYRFMLRPNSFNHLHYSRALFHQFAVDMWAKAESEKLRYIRTHQKELRSEQYIHLRDAINNDYTGHDVGQLCILPSSFVGGPRYMHERAQDGMAYVRHYGRADLFITFTCNSKWPEIVDELLHNQRNIDRHDLTARVFHLKLQRLMSLIRAKEIFGKLKCYLYSIEWQKRGLPHAHMLIWLQPKLRPADIDHVICAEIPDPDTDPQLHEIVKRHMVHGPCGSLNPASPCMVNGKCSKRYPRPFLLETQTGEDGYPQYRRRPPPLGFVTTVGSYTVDNHWIVPYCPYLSKTFDAHINVEFCNSVKSIKYVCKYIYKGPDAAMFALKDVNTLDEVTYYQHGRYLSSNEAFWRFFGFLLHDHFPAVQHLAVHLDNGQRVVFTPETATQKALHPTHTTLTAFFDLCRNDDFAATLLYPEVPSYYTWDNSSRTWKRRVRGTPLDGHPGINWNPTISRMYTIHPSQHECFFLRLLLHNVQGPTSFEALRTVNGVVYNSYRHSCLLRGLLHNDDHWDATLAEAVISRSPRSLRCLFAVLLKTCDITNPLVLWNSYKDDLSEDFHHSERGIWTDQQQPHINLEDSHNKALIALEDFLITMGGDPLPTYGLPSPNRMATTPPPTDLLRETSYDTQFLIEYVAENEGRLTNEQLTVLNTIYDSIYSPTTNGAKIFFIDAPGGTGKTFLMRLLLAKVRQQKHVALAVASSGIAATLLPGGRTSHSTFKLPLDLTVTDSPVCNISKTSAMAEVIRRCKLIIWDECTMTHKHALEAVDRTLQDLRNVRCPMGGITTVLSGDFRQTLPVIKRGTKADEIAACLKYSYLWNHVTTLTLSTNMRARLSGDLNATEFSETLLALGNGELQKDNDGCVSVSSLSTISQSLEDLIRNVFPSLQTNYESQSWLCERAILAPTNMIVSHVNSTLLNQLPGEPTVYTSIDTTLDTAEAINYPTEFLNSQQPPGFPPHNLILKVGAPIILLRNLHPPNLCNGTRLIVTHLRPHVIVANIMTGCGKGETVFIPRIPLITSDDSFTFQRRQFPIQLSFAITINKAQGQTLHAAGLSLNEPCFTHGQLYVGCSRVGSPNNLFIAAPEGKTRNIVYHEVLR